MLPITNSTRNDPPIRLLLPPGRRVSVTLLGHARASVRPLVAPLEPFASRLRRLLGEDLVRLAGADELIVPAGLAPAVGRELGAAGYTVTFDDSPASTPVAVAHVAVVAAAAGDDRRFLSAVANNRAGLIELAHGNDLLRWVGQLLDLFPDARVVVLVPDRVNLGGYAIALKEHLGVPVGRVTRTRRVEPRCVVAAYATVALYRPDRPVVLVVPDADRNPVEACRAVGWAAGVARVFAFAHDLRHFAADDRLAVTAVAGEVIVSAAATSAPARVFVLPTPAAPPARAEAPLEYKRAAYWHNAGRNRLVAAVARAALAGDRAALAGLGLPVAEGELPRTTSVPRVLVLVESPEHGRALADLLAGWPLLTRCTNAVTVPAPGVVATVPYAAHNSVPPDVVVRATGESGPLPVAGFPWPARFDQTIPVVIDFGDRSDPPGRRNTGRRVAEYRRAGWPVEELTACGRNTRSNPSDGLTGPYGVESGSVRPGSAAG